MNMQRLLIPILACLFATTAWADVEINETTFPDANFRNWVLGQEYGSDGVLTDEEIASVKNINVAGKEIQSLKGIEFFTALTRLTCPSNQLTELDLSRNIKLKNVYCIDNQLTSLDLTSNTELIELDCLENQLQTLNVSNINLSRLNCENNQLTELNVSGCTSLSSLNCSFNQLASIDVSTCAGLTSFACVQNLLTEIDVSKNSRLNSLECSANKLTTLDLSGCMKLVTLHCDENLLTSLDVSMCQEMSYLSCYSNLLTSLTLDVSNTELLYIYCYNNQIKGEAMDLLVANLPTRNDIPGSLIIHNKVYETEQNEMSSEQVSIVKKNNWQPLDSGWNEYAGYDVFNVLNSPRAAAPNAQCIYNLSGQRITRPRKGLFITGGRKVVVK